MAILPGVPLVHTEQFVALRVSVEGFITSPFRPELLSSVTVAS